MSVADARDIESADDRLLMAHLAAGDRNALAELVRRHQMLAFRLAYRTTGNRATAEDITQDAFLRVWRSAARYEPTASFETWLHRIVVNLCLDQFKKRKPVQAETADPATEIEDSPGASLERDERADRVRKAVQRLPERQRIAVILHRFSEFPQRRIAEITGWSVSAVESLLVRAYAGLRDALDEGEIKKD